ncbi:MAG: glycosyltransferase family 1 protein [Methylovulum sp.]|nr:glycosyltransferase family 1 protein [Methylovulum sp.]
MNKLVINGRFLTQSMTGVQRYAHEFVHALDSLLEDRPDLEVRLLSPRLCGNAPVYRHIIHQSVGRLQGHLWEQLELPRFVNGAPLFCPGNTAPIASLLGAGRVVVTVHDLSYLYFPQAYSSAFRLLYNTLMPLILRRAAAVITVSNSERESILKHYPFAKERLTAIQNGGLPTGVVAPPVAPADEPYVLYVGSLSKRKNFPGMLEVACRLASKRGLRFVFVGGVPDGIADSVTRISHDIRDRIVFLGQVNDWEVLMKHYRSATCFFFPSFYEASPLPPIEAMACGCPVIAASISSLRERCGDAALYCDPASIESMANAVECLVDDPVLQHSLRAKGYQRAERYSWANCAKQTLALAMG